MINKLRITAVAVFLLSAFSASSQVVQTPSGPLEFIGLQSWKAQTLWDSIYAHAPGDGAHACMAVLKKDFGFEDALVVMFPNGDSVSWVAFVVEEPNREDPFFKACPTGVYPMLPEWQRMDSLLKQWRFLSQITLASYPYIVKGDHEQAMDAATSWGDALRSYGYEEELAGAEREGVEPAWEFLRSCNTTKARDLSLRILADDSSATARRLAVLTLINFPWDDTVRWKLVEALRDPDPLVPSLASTVLLTMEREFDHATNWEPALPLLRRIIAGETVSQMNTIMQTLQTRPDSILGRKLLRNNCRMISIMLNAETRSVRNMIYDFLKQMTGRDFGMNAKEWEAWANR